DYVSLDGYRANHLTILAFGTSTVSWAPDNGPSHLVTAAAALLVPAIRAATEIATDKKSRLIISCVGFIFCSLLLFWAVSSFSRCPVIATFRRVPPFQRRIPGRESVAFLGGARGRRPQHNRDRYGAVVRIYWFSLRLFLSSFPTLSVCYFDGT